LTGTKTEAYFSSTATTKKSPETFSSSLTLPANKLERSSLAKYFSPSHILWISSGLTRKYYTRLKRLAGRTLFVRSIRERKKILVTFNILWPEL